MDIDDLSEDDKALVTKAMLLGCKFRRSEVPTNRLYYPGFSPGHPMSKAKYAHDGFYGYEDPVHLAQAYIEYMERTHAAIP